MKNLAKHFLFPKRALLCAILIIYVILNFWLTSRYPALGQKQIEGAFSEITNLQTMWPAYTVAADAPFWERVYYKTLNWVLANLQGMKFGLLIGGLFLAFFQQARLPRGLGRFSSAFSGFVFGAPMGVCVNCAAPLMRGLAGSGNIIFSVSAMLASPVFNVVVLSMLFTLFPLPLALAKVGLSLLIILVILPMFAGKEAMVERVALAMDPVAEGWLSALWGLTKQLAVNVAKVFLTSAPLMVLAGGLSVVLTELVDFRAVSLGLPFLPSLLLASLIAVFVPLPMAFDLVVAYSLYGAGAPMGVVMAVLFGLGSFSVYSAMEVARVWSMRRAWQLSGVFVMLCVCAGLLMEVYHRRSLDTLLGSTVAIADASFPGELSRDFRPTPGAWAGEREEKAGDFLLRILPLKPASPAAEAGSIFRKLAPLAVGISYRDETLWPFAEPEVGAQRGSTVADLNGDGWQDLLVSRSDGISAFLNRGGRFEAVSIPSLEGIAPPILLVVAEDFNGDGRQDLAISNYEGFYLFLARGDGYTRMKRVEFPAAKGRFVTALAAHDLNRDGVLDIFLGVSGTGQFMKNKSSEENGNLLFISDAQGWQPANAPSAQGETLAALFTDIDGDFRPELVIANDFGLPSLAYRALDSAPWLEPYAHPDLAQMPGSGMSVDSADISRRDKLDFLISASWTGGNSPGATTVGEACGKVSAEARGACELRARFSFTANPQMKRNVTTSQCDGFKAGEREQCLSVLRLWAVAAEGRRDLCAGFKRENFLRLICDHFFLPTKANGEKVTGRSFMGHSELYVREGKGWKREAKKFGLADTGWSWESKFADYDLDGDIDLLVTNGFLHNGLGQGNMLNLLFRNDGQGGLRREELPEFAGSFMNSGFLKFDYDNDGDLDLVTLGTMEPLAFYENGSQSRRVAFEFREKGRAAYGATVRFHLLSAKGEKSVLRHEVKFAPGLMSHDGPRLVVGLGQSERLAGFEITWADGEKSSYMKEIEAGQFVSVER